MAFLAGEGGRASLIGTAAREALLRRASEIGGAAMLSLGLLLGLVLASYHAGDPSHFSASGSSPQNWLGRPGAILADPLMRFLGLGAWMLAAFPVVWGARLVLHRGEQRIWARLLVLPPATVVLAAFASTHAPGIGWPAELGLGGHVGDSLAGALLGLAGAPTPGTLAVLSALLGAVAGLLGALALGVVAPEIGRVGGWLVRSLRITCLIAFGRLGQLAALMTGRVARARLRMPAAQEGIGSVLARLSPEGGKRKEPAAPLGPVAAPIGPSPLGSAIEALQRAGAPSGDNKMPRADGFGVIPSVRTARRDPDAPRPRALGTAITADEAADAEDETLRPSQGPAPQEDRGYEAPPLDVLQTGGSLRTEVSEAELEQSARKLETVLADYGVRGEITAVKPGPVVTLYELEPAPGLKAARVIGLADDIARSMEALAARVSTMPGRSVIGIELPNDRRETVYLRELLEAEDYADTRHALALALGKSIGGDPVVANLARMPHLLIAGTTGSGKSVAINTMILSLLYRLSPEQCRVIMIDPKMLELSVYDGIPHLLAPVVTDPKKALVALKWVVGEMEERYRRMSKLGVRNLDGYNARVRDAIAKGEDFSRTVQTGFDPDTGEPVFETETIAPEAMPLIVVIVDEMADLMMVAGKEIEACIQRLAQMARASGIHLIMATQRPSVDVITGTIKANFPTRISFQVTSKIDSRTILGEQGAEQLLGQGDMLYMASGGRVKRVHGPFVSDDEVEEVVRHLKALGPPDYVGAVTEGGDDETQALIEEKLGLGQPGDSEDALYDRAVAIVARDRKCSTSYIQRKLQIGYNKAARLVEEMEAQGVVSTANAVGKREILIEER
ncbi:MAG: DNA translocase FtsK 4TM domain-containing protein [Pseudomonadota bacterium]